MAGLVIFKLPLSKVRGRLDPAANRNWQPLTSMIYQNVVFPDIATINPSTSFNGITDDTLVTFIPMDSVNQIEGQVTDYQTRQYGESKGYTKFQEGDILWAKITPCMENGKSTVATNLLLGRGFGSTEFHVFRVNINVADIQYVHALLRLQRLRDAAVNFFGGSAGHQRVDTVFFNRLRMPLPPLDVQQKVAFFMQTAYAVKKRLEKDASALLSQVKDVLLSQLGITLPKSDSGSLHERLFKVKLTELSGNIFDPKTHSPQALALFAAIRESAYPRLPLRDVITHRMAGDWGEDEDWVDTADTHTKCLVIRGTEFDNEFNLHITNGREKYRKIPSAKLTRMKIEAGDLLIEKSGGSPDQPVGRVAILDAALLNSNSVCYSNFVEKIKPDRSKVLPEFLFHYLRFVHAIGVTDLLQSQTNGIRNLMIHRYLDLPVSLPTMDEQVKIVAKVQLLQSQATALRQQALQKLGAAKAQVEHLIFGTP